MPIIEEGEILEFPYVIYENDSMRHLCGYLAVHKEHPWYGKDRYDLNIEVHGGVTFNAKTEDVDWLQSNTQIVDHWWIGFDCAHYMDLIPNIAEDYPQFHNHGEIYRDRDYVYNELVKMTYQADEADK